MCARKPEGQNRLAVQWKYKEESRRVGALSYCPWATQDLHHGQSLTHLDIISLITVDILINFTYKQKCCEGSCGTREWQMQCTFVNKTDEVKAIKKRGDWSFFHKRRLALGYQLFLYRIPFLLFFYFTSRTIHTSLISLLLPLHMQPGIAAVLIYTPVVFTL